MLKHAKAVLFDLDGTLVDSMWMWKDIDMEYLGKYGITLPPELQEYIEGMSFSEVSAYFKETFKIKESLEEIKSEWVSMAKYKYTHEVPLKPGALRFLKHLKEQRIPKDRAERLPDFRGYAGRNPGREPGRNPRVRYGGREFRRPQGADLTDGGLLCRNL